MKTKRYVVSIPEPCHEDWNKMTPDDKGRFCGSCAKSVFDFSNKSDDEIQSTLEDNKGTKLCGRFKTTQLNRPLNISVPYHLLPKNISPIRAFALSLFFVFGTTLFSCKTDNGQEVGEVSMDQTDNNYSTAGIMMVDTRYIDSLPIVDSIQLKVKESLEKPIEVQMVNGGIGYYEERITELNEITVVTGETMDYNTVGMMSIQIVPGEIIPIPTIDSTETAVVNDNTVIDAVKDFSLEAYPNPTDGKFNIAYTVLEKTSVSIFIFNLEGVLVKTIVPNQEQYEGKYILPTDISELANGTYIVQLANGTKTKTEKIVLSR